MNVVGPLDRADPFSFELHRLSEVGVSKQPPQGKPEQEHRADDCNDHFDPQGRSRRRDPGLLATVMERLVLLFHRPTS